MAFRCVKPRTHSIFMPDNHGPALSLYPSDEKSKHEHELPHIRCVLLGCSGSGKTTIFKNLKIIFRRSFYEEERVLYKSIIVKNVLDCIKELIQQAEKNGVELNSHTKVSAERIMQLKYTGVENLPKITKDDIKILWNDPGITSENNFPVIECAAHFVDSIHKILSPDYIPTLEDIVRCRSKTTAITEIGFHLDGINFHVMDVGGLRAERKKWAHCFTRADVVIYCVSLTEYDQKLAEDTATNRMHESLSTFQDILQLFPDSTIILCLCKKDLFQEKLKSADLSICFPEYDGRNDPQKTLEFIRNKFLSLNNNSQRIIYPLTINATSAGEIVSSFHFIKDVMKTKIW